MEPEEQRERRHGDVFSADEGGWLSFQDYSEEGVEPVRGDNRIDRPAQTRRHSYEGTR
jgi:hypothetical protein